MKHPLPTKTYCIIDRREIPIERQIRKSPTCRKECRDILEKMRRASTEERKCRVCSKPSTPAQRKAFSAWLRNNPDFKPPKRGRPTKENDETKSEKAEAGATAKA